MVSDMEHTSFTLHHNLQKFLFWDTYASFLQIRTDLFLQSWMQSCYRIMLLLHIVEWYKNSALRNTSNIDSMQKLDRRKPDLK